MSIIIKGLDMPSSCYMCWVNHYCEAIINPPIARANGRGEHCPLVEIPKGHGRLIDADELLDRMLEQPHWVVKIEEVSTSVYRDVDVLPEIRHSPTILEAEET